MLRSVPGATVGEPGQHPILVGKHRVARGDRPRDLQGWVVPQYATFRLAIPGRGDLVNDLGVRLERASRAGGRPGSKAAASFALTARRTRSAGRSASQALCPQRRPRSRRGPHGSACPAHSARSADAVLAPRPPSARGLSCTNGAEMQASARRRSFQVSEKKPRSSRKRGGVISRMSGIAVGSTLYDHQSSPRASSVSTRPRSILPTFAGRPGRECLRVSAASRAFSRC
jgi:hypothetical protein